MSDLLQLSNDHLRRIYHLLVSTAIFTFVLFAREILIPVMLAVLMVIVVSPLVFRIERLGFPRAWSVAATSVFVFLVVGTIGAITANQLWSLLERVPEYKENLVARIEAIRPSGNSTITRAFRAFDQIESTLRNKMTDSTAGNATSNGAAPETDLAISSSNPQQRSVPLAGDKANEPVSIDDSTVNVRVVESPTTVGQLSSWMNPVLGPLGTIGLVAVLVVFILLNLEDLHERFTRLTGNAALPRSNIALNDAILRVSRYIQMTFVVNTIYGFVVAVGLWLIGVPNPVFWGVAGTVLRFVPYLGPVISFSMPFAVSLAATATWSAPIMTSGLFLILELVLNNIIEPWLYGRSTGVSSVGVIFGSVIWAWVWGPMGLILATPMTVLLVVTGRHFPQLQFMTTLFAERNSFQPHDELFQHLLSEDDSEAERVASKFSETRTLQEVCDDLYLPALKLLYENRKSARVVDSLSDSICQRLVKLAKAIDSKDYVSGASQRARRNEASIVIVPERRKEDQTASQLLQHVLLNHGYHSIVREPDLLSSELMKELLETAPETLVFSSVENRSTTLFRATYRRIQQAGLNIKVLRHVWSERQTTDGQSSTSIVETVDAETTFSISSTCAAIAEQCCAIRVEDVSQAMLHSEPELMRTN